MRVLSVTAFSGLALLVLWAMPAAAVDAPRPSLTVHASLYRYVGDRRALQVLCQNVREFGGLWLVVRPDGTVVR